MLPTKHIPAKIPIGNSGTDAIGAVLLVRAAFLVYGGTSREILQPDAIGKGIRFRHRIEVDLKMKQDFPRSDRPHISFKQLGFLPCIRNERCAARHEQERQTQKEYPID